MDVSLDAPLERKVRAFELWKEVSKAPSELRLDFVRGIWFNLLEPHSPLYSIYERFFEGLFSLEIQITEMDEPAFIEYRSPAGVFVGIICFDDPQIQGPLATSSSLASFFSVHPRWEKKESLLMLSLDQNDVPESEGDLACFGLIESGRVVAFKEGVSGIYLLDEKGQKQISIEQLFQEVLGVYLAS
jgi:hypothetical protein